MGSRSVVIGAAFTAFTVAGMIPAGGIAGPGSIPGGRLGVAARGAVALSAPSSAVAAPSAVLAPAGGAISGAAISGAVAHKGLSLLQGAPGAKGTGTSTGAAGAGGRVLGGIATFGALAPTPAQIQGLKSLGLRVQPLAHLPLALVQGSPGQLLSAVTSGLAGDVYPNGPMHFFSATSDASIDALGLHAGGVDGRGVGVAIVDSGIDATHPDLAHRVTHNVKIVDAEYLGLPPATAPGPIVLPVDQGPYNNTDLTGGHGTHVAGIVAADGHTSPEQTGVAPGANLIGYSAGDTLEIFAVLASFDDILAHRQAWNIRVVSNSWGSSFRTFDPADPVNVATRALHDAGITVVFAAGNDSTEMSLNPYAAAPWVISVGAGTLDHQRAGFSSAGIEFDDSAVAALASDRHVRFTGDGMGIYHPDVTAPGVNIVSSGTPTGIGILSPAPIGGTTRCRAPAWRRRTSPGSPPC